MIETGVLDRKIEFSEYTDVSFAESGKHRIAWKYEPAQQNREGCGRQGRFDSHVLDVSLTDPQAPRNHSTAFAVLDEATFFIRFKH